MIVLTEKEVYTDAPETMRVHRTGTDAYFTRCTRLASDMEEGFEEVRIEDVPKTEDIDEPLTEEMT